MLAALVSERDKGWYGVLAQPRVLFLSDFLSLSLLSSFEMQGVPAWKVFVLLLTGWLLLMKRLLEFVSFLDLLLRSLPVLLFLVKMESNCSFSSFNAQK